MRPVNLILPEDRRGEQAPLRTGPLSYILLGGLVLLLIGVVALVLTGNQISKREDEVAKLKREDAAATAQAAKLASYTQFRDLSEARVATVQSLADSRFDWERVLRELALVLPGDVSLTDLTATVSASSSSGDSTGGSSGGAGGLRGAVPGPALELNGCAAGQPGVAGFITSLKDIDGVTRVGVQSSAVASEAGESGGGESSAECGGGAGNASFSLVVAFDAAPIPASGEEVAVAPEAAPEAAQAASSETSESPTETPAGG
jgi:Tfp pilus assembly protein PilN